MNVIARLEIELAHNDVAVQYRNSSYLVIVLFVTQYWPFVVSVCVGASQSIPFFFFWCEIHTKGLSPKFPSRPEEEEGRKVRESTEVDKGPAQRRGQSTEVGGSRQSREGSREEKESVDRREKSRRDQDRKQVSR